MTGDYLYFVRTNFMVHCYVYSIHSLPVYCFMKALSRRESVNITLQNQILGKGKRGKRL